MSLRGIYRGPIQALTLEGRDIHLVPGQRVEDLPDCEYTQSLVTSGHLVLDRPATRVTSKRPASQE